MSTEVTPYTWRAPQLFVGATPPERQVDALEGVVERIADEDRDDFTRDGAPKPELRAMFDRAGVDVDASPELLDQVRDIRQGLTSSEGRYRDRPNAGKDAMYDLLRNAAEGSALPAETNLLTSPFGLGFALPPHKVDDPKWEAPEPDITTVRGAAQSLLDSPNVSFWDDLSTGSDRRALEQIARTGRADVPVTGGHVTPNRQMMTALAEMAEKGPIQITALTGGEHSVGSNHYDGNAVDLSIYTGDAAEIEAIANAHGGTRNFETDHIHLDFL